MFTKNLLQRWLAGFLLLVIMFVSMGNTQCSGNKRSAFEKGFAASVRISAMGASAGESILKAYNDGVISLETKDKIFDKLKIIGVAGRQFHNTLAGLAERYPDGIVPESEMQPLQLLFNEQIYGPLMAILSLAGVLTGPQMEAIKLAMAGLKLVIFTVRGSMLRLTGKIPAMRGGVEYGWI